MADVSEITELASPESIALEVDRLYGELPAAVKNAYKYKATSIGLLDGDRSQLALDTVTRIHGTYMRKKERSRNAARVKAAKIKALKDVPPIEEIEEIEEIAEVAAEEEVAAVESADESVDEQSDSEPDNEPIIEKVEPDNLSNIRELLSRSTNELPQPKKTVMPKRAAQRVSGSGLLSL